MILSCFSSLGSVKACCLNLNTKRHFMVFDLKQSDVRKVMVISLSMHQPWLTNRLINYRPLQYKKELGKSLIISSIVNSSQVQNRYGTRGLWSLRFNITLI